MVRQGEKAQAFEARSLRVTQYGQSLAGIAGGLQAVQHLRVILGR